VRKLFALPALLVGILCSAPSWAQSTTSIDLAGTWKFAKGDNKTWANNAFDDALWKDIRVPGSWQSQGNDATGFAWYRKHITLPADWGKDPVVLGEKVLRLDLGRIADAYEVFWNGKVITAGGKLPPAFAPAPSDVVHAGVPADTSTFGGENILAVRVFSNKTPASGILEGPLVLREPTFADFITMEVAGQGNRVEFDRKDGLPFDIIVANNGHADWQKGTVMLSILDGGGKVITSSPIMEDVSAGKQKRTSIALKEEELNPGLYTVSAEIQMNGKTLQRVSKTFVYYPAGIRSEAFHTADQLTAFKTKLDAFWKTTIVALKNTPIGGSSEFSQERSTDKVKVYKVTFNALKGQTIYGWLAVPAGASKSPGVLVMPGYGNSAVEPANFLAEAGFATLSINVHGADVDAKTYASEAEAYMKGGFADPNTFVMRGMVSAGLRALDYLAQRPEVDAGKLGVIGMSQGGGLAADVAALDPRVKTLVASSPIADFQRMFAQATSNPASVILQALDASSRAQLTNTLNYFDPVFLADRIKVPSLITVGFVDNVVPPETAYALKSAFEPGVYVSINADEQSGHAVTEGQRDAAIKWLRKFLIG
jgi:cephalosporin-C deacetylase